MAGSLPTSAYILTGRTRRQRNDLGRRAWVLRRKPEQGEGRRVGSWRERAEGGVIQSRTNYWTRLLFRF